MDRFEARVDELPEPGRAKAERILSDVAAVVPLEPVDVRSRPEVFEFLLDEMPFTGGVVRELGRGKWEITQEPGSESKDVFGVVDPSGYRLRFELLKKEPGRRVYLTTGAFEMGILPRLIGSTLIVMRMEPAGEVVRTDARVYVRVETQLYATPAKGFKGLVEEKVRERAGCFIQAAKWVAEESAQRPEWLVQQVEGSRKVDQDVLREFRKRFLK